MYINTFRESFRFRRARFQSSADLLIQSRLIPRPPAFTILPSLTPRYPMIEAAVGYVDSVSHQFQLSTPHLPSPSFALVSNSGTTTAIREHSKSRRATQPLKNVFGLVDLLYFKGTALSCDVGAHHNTACSKIHTGAEVAAILA